MTHSDIVLRRLHNQHISNPANRSAGALLGTLVAVQAQEYAGAKWGLGLRTSGANEAEIEEAFNSGAILRTHLMRPTWHFVAPEDIRWLLALTAPRVEMANGSMYRKMELDEKTFRRSNDAIARSLQGGNQLTRDELRERLAAAGIATSGEQRMAYLMMHAELQGVVCSGARRGRQFTYALLEERVPPAPQLDRDEARARLASRYFKSRGPATVHDFAKWSGLTVSDARRGLDTVQEELAHETVEGTMYWFPPSSTPGRRDSPTVDLLSIYDEYISSYRDRSAVANPEYAHRLGALGNALTAVVLLDGRIVGTWKRTLHTASVAIETDIYPHLSRTQREAVAAATERYGAFLGLPVDLAPNVERAGVSRRSGAEASASASHSQQQPHR